MPKVRRQPEWRFGGRGTATTDIEADETVFGHWRRVDPATGEVVHYWWVWLGVAQRGDHTKLWLKPVGVTESRGEQGRVPPLQRQVDHLMQDVALTV